VLGVQKPGYSPPYPRAVSTTRDSDQLPRSFAVARGTYAVLIITTEGPEVKTFGHFFWDFLGIAWELLIPVLREALSAPLAGREGSGKGILPSWRGKPIHSRRARSPVRWG
jgi:hypothetical protein